MNWGRVATLILLPIFLTFVVPHYLLPLLSNTIGLKIFDGLHRVRIYMETVVVPIPIFTTPDSYTFIGFSVSGLAAILYLLKRDKVKMDRILRKQISPLVTLTASYIRTGMSILDALDEAGKTLGRPIYNYVAKFVELVKLGYSPEEAFNASFSSIPRDVRAPLVAIMVAIGSGGRVNDILSAAERYTFQMSRLDEFRRYRLGGYRAVLLLAVIAFAMSSILTLTILSYASKSLSLSGLVAGGFKLELVASMYYIPAMIIVTASSIAMSRIVYGETTTALKYIAIISPVISIVFAVATHLL